MPASQSPFSPEFVLWANSVKTSKRARAALKILLERGSVTTGDLKDAGYDHPPRVARDLKDAGFAVESKLVSVAGIRMSRYTLLDTVSSHFAQRRPIPAAFRLRLFELNDYRCSVCGGIFPARMLQADHRVPFHVGGDPAAFKIVDFMPLCASDNRAKSMSCETCPNWQVGEVETCKTCYWHDPEDYAHVMTLDERRLVLNARGSSVSVVDALKADATSRGIRIGDLVLERLTQVMGR